MSIRYQGTQSRSKLRLSAAEAHLLAGRFVEALQPYLEVTSESDPIALSEKAFLLERVGQSMQARLICQRLTARRNCTPSVRSRCEFVEGQINWEEGRIAAAIERFQAAAKWGRVAEDADLVFWPQLRLYGVLTDQRGPDAGAPTLVELRRIALGEGSPVLVAALHVMVGQVEAKRGGLLAAVRHSKISLELIRSTPNAWLQALAFNNLVAVALMQHRYDEARLHAGEAIRWAECSGSPSTIRACLGTRGYLDYCCGLYEDSEACLRRAMATGSFRGEAAHAAMDTLALVCLAKREWDRCVSLLDEIEDGATDATRSQYAYRNARLTLAKVRFAQQRYEEAVEVCRDLVERATAACDVPLRLEAIVRESEALVAIGRGREAAGRLSELSPLLCDSSPGLRAKYERAVASVLESRGYGAESQMHGRLAMRLLEATTHGVRDVDHGRTESVVGALGMPGSQRCMDAEALLSMATAMRFADNSEVVEGEIAYLVTGGRLGALLRSAVGVSGASKGSVLRSKEASLGEPGVMACSEPGLAPTDDEADCERLALRSFEEAAEVLLAGIKELGRARADRHERVQLWPMDEAVVTDGAVIAGRMRSVVATAMRVAKTNVPVLLTGESGTGKEVVARAIHEASERSGMPFVPLNCTAVHGGMLESQLFGYRKGAFTGADRDYPGLLMAAHGGTVLLDEIGDLSLELQPKLLRFLENGEILPVGGLAPHRIDVRVIAATNRGIEQAVADGLFREDLYYRLNVVRIEVPPLRERRDEIPGLISFCLKRFSAELGKGNVRFSEDAFEHLLLYRWPGNVRELSNEIRRVVAMADIDELIGAETLKHAVTFGHVHRAVSITDSDAGSSRSGSLQLAVDKLERSMIAQALREAGGRVDVAAKSLGVSRKGLYLKRQRLGIG